MRKQEIVKLETKNRIMNAFWELYKTTNIERITVKRITDACGIYRTTFYLHFADVYAILEQIEADLIADVKGFTLEAGCSSQNKEEIITKVCQSFKKNYDYLNVLLDKKHDQRFAVAYKKEIAELMCIMHQVDLNNLNAEAKEIAVKSFSAMIDLFMSLGDSSHVSLDQAIRIIDGYMNDGILKTLHSIYGN